MAVDKSFVVKNGLEVNSDLIVADASSKKVGIASTGPRSTLDVRGGIAATDINISGIATIANLQVTAGDVDFTNLKVTGFSTLGGLTVDQLTVTGFTTFTDLSYDEITGRNLNLTGIATIPVIVGIASFTDAISSRDVNVSGVATITTANVTTANVTTLAGYPNFSGGATVVGTVTAAHFSGGGLGVGIKTTGSVVGYGFTMLNFVGSGNTFAVNGTTVDISIAGGGGGGSASIGVGSTPGDAFTGIITAGNLWYNTGLGRLFIYYQDDNSAQWVDAAPFNVGIITTLTNVAFSAGTAFVPAISFGNDTNSGFYLPVDEHPAVTSNGSEVARFNPSGVNVSGITTATGFKVGAAISISDGAVSATRFHGDGSALTGIDATAIKDSGGNVKAQANPNGIVVTGILTGSTAKFTGVVTASSFEGDGSNLTNLPAGLGTALSSVQTSPLNKIYYTDQVLGVASTITIDPPSTAVVAYTQYAEIEVSGDADLIVADGDEFVPNILGIGTTQTLPALGKSGGRVRADNFADASGTGAPEFTAGLTVSGVCTATSFSGSLNGNVTGVAATFTGNVSIAGTLTYQDVENVDSIGVITARNGVKTNVSPAITIRDGTTEKGYIGFNGNDPFIGRKSGVGVAFQNNKIRPVDGDDGSASNNTVDIGENTYKFKDGYFAGTLTSGNVSIADSILHTGDTDTAIRFPAADTFTVQTNGAERLRITSGGGFHFTNGELIEQANITAGKLSDNTNIDLENGMVHLFTTTETTTSTPNIRVNSSTSLNSVMAIGEVISVTLITTAAAAGYSAQLTIDGGAVTENWTGGSAPSTGGSSGVDIYAYTIIKTADATFTVIGTLTTTS